MLILGGQVLFNYVSFEIFTAVQLRTLFCWDMTLRYWAIRYI